MAGRTRNPGPSTTTRAAVQSLQKAHKLGKKMKKVLRRKPGRKYNERGEYQRIGNLNGMSAELCRKHVAFADRYTDKDLELLCQQCLDYDHPLGFQLVVKLLPIKNKRRREQLQKRAIKEKWTFRQLVRYLREYPSTRTMQARRDSLVDKLGRGRHSLASRSLEDLLGEIKCDAAKWNRVWLLLQKERMEEQESSPGPSGSRHITAQDLELAFIKDLDRLIEAFRRLTNYEM